MNLLKNLIYFILSIQEKLLRKSLSGTLGVRTASSRKKVYARGCLLSLETIAQSQREKMEEELRLILKSSNYNPDEVLEYIKKHGTGVYFIKNSCYLNPINEKEGFIYPQKGLEALYLSLLTENKIRFKTDEMFVLSKGSVNKYYFLYHFYNWYAFKHNIAGLDAESRVLLEKYLYSDENLNKLQLAEIYKLKDAIKQDKASIEFVVKLCRDYDGAKQALEKLKDKGAADI